ncbi:MAG: amidohydrolase family protein, partial [Bacteroidota bacterium]
GLLKMRINAMIADNELNEKYYFEHGPYQTDRLTVRSFKFYADGALGSRGALLKKPYTDDAKNYGLLLKPADYFERKFAECYSHGFQVCTHCIGDSANKLMLDQYGKILGGKNMKRWRIEHAQIVSPTDMNLFAKYSIIPSIQPCFTTSDMYWAKDRVGEHRMVGAYSWKSLLLQTNIVACGSDFPVEDINPLFGFFAAITREDQKLFPAGGYMPDQKLSRLEALYGMTTWASYAEFGEETKGNLTTGMVADFVVLDNDIMTMPSEETFKTKVLMTFVNGEMVYKK